MELDKNKLLKLYPQYTSVLGPYKRSDGRKHIVLNNCSLPNGTKGKTKTISYPKALFESESGRKLLPNETVDHHDRDKSNDDLSNLVIREKSKHSSLDALRVKVEDINCTECGKSFTPSKSQRNSQTSNDDSQPAGPFCSRHCSGKYGARVRSTGEKLERQKIVKTYYLPEK